MFFIYVFQKKNGPIKQETSSHEPKAHHTALTFHCYLQTVPLQTLYQAILRELPTSLTKQRAQQHDETLRFVPLSALGSGGLSEFFLKETPKKELQTNSDQIYTILKSCPSYIFASHVPFWYDAEWKLECENIFHNTSSSKYRR